MSEEKKDCRKALNQKKKRACFCPLCTRYWRYGEIEDINDCGDGQNKTNNAKFNSSNVAPIKEICTRQYGVTAANERLINEIKRQNDIAAPQVLAFEQIKFND